MTEDQIRQTIAKAIEGVTVPLVMTDVLLGLRQGIEHGVRFCHAEMTKKEEKATTPETWGSPAAVDDGVPFVTTDDKGNVTKGTVDKDGKLHVDEDDSAEDDE